MLILLTIEALLFGLFTTCMACEQITSVMYNQTYIDRLQAKRGDASKCAQLIATVVYLLLIRATSGVVTADQSHQW